MKYSKGIVISKPQHTLRIMVTDKDSFEECNKEILEELQRHPGINPKDKEQIIKKVLCG